MQQQIEAPKGAKASKVQRLLCSLGSWAKRAATGPSPTHSILFGAAAGLCSYGIYYGYRLGVVSLFDSSHYAVASRSRYAEKQQLFFQELDEALAAGALASLVKEYDPVSTRLPFKPLEEKYRI